MIQPSRCSICNGSLIAGRCLSCDARRWSRLVDREFVLVTLLVGVTIATFVGTRAFADANEAMHRDQAAAWFAAAQRASNEGHADAAIGALRRALSKDPGNMRYRLTLADALVEGHLDAAAERLWLATHPEDPETTLRLARLAARGSDAGAARRYYQNAVAALWKPEHADARRRVRTELIEFLLAHDEPARALSELLVLAATLPDEAALHTQVGRMFLAAGDPRLALNQFVRAIRLDSSNATALAGAGEAAFEAGDYNRALRYLGAVPPENAHAAELRELSELVVNGDPLAPRLTTIERRRRLLAAFDSATQRLAACLRDPAASTEPVLQALEEEAGNFGSELTLRGPRETRAVVDDGVDLVYRIERAVEQSCGAPARPLDRAIVLIGRRHGLDPQ